MEKDSAVMQNTNYKLLDLMKFICAFLVIGIHTRPFQVVSDVADKLFYYDISNYAVPFFYACTGYFLIVRQQNKGVHEKICFRIKKVLRLYVIWSIIYLPLTFCGEGAVQLLNVVPEGKKPMDGTAFAAGQRLKAGDIL